MSPLTPTDMALLVIGQSLLLFVNEYSARHSAQHWLVFHKYLLNEKVYHGQHNEVLNLSQFLVSFEVQLLIYEDKI